MFIKFAKSCRYKTVSYIYNNICRAMIITIEDQSSNLLKVGNKYLRLYEHEYNCGFYNERMTERACELSLAWNWLEKMMQSGAEILEVGAVTPYYKPGFITDILDPYDSNPSVNIKKDLFDVDFSGLSVLSISTVEHVGTGDYGLPLRGSSVSAVEKILSECEHCLITVPIGYNPLLDTWLYDSCDERITFYARGSFDNKWKETTATKALKKKYRKLGWANAIAVIEK